MKHKANNTPLFACLDRRTNQEVPSIANLARASNHPQGTITWRRKQWQSPILQWWVALDLVLSSSFFLTWTKKEEGVGDNNYLKWAYSHGMIVHTWTAIESTFCNVRSQCQSPLLAITTVHRQLLNEICYQIEVHQIIPMLPPQINTELQPKILLWSERVEECQYSEQNTNRSPFMQPSNIPSKFAVHLWFL